LKKRVCISNFNSTKTREYEWLKLKGLAQRQEK